MRKFPTVLRAYWVGLLVLFALSYASWQFFVHVQGKTQFPYSEILLPSIYDGQDFTCFSDRFEHFHTAAFFGDGKQVFNYPAPLAVVYEVFYALSAHPAELFRLTFILVYISAGIVCWKALRKQKIEVGTAVAFVTTAMLFSYPFLLAFYLENVELAVCLLVAVGIALYIKDYGWASVACFGIAGSMKYFPLVYLGLALARRQYRQVAFGLVVCAFTSLSSLAILGPTLTSAYQGLHAQVPVFTDYYIYKFHPLESGIDHSLFALVKLILYVCHHVTWCRYASRIYLALVALSGLVLYIVRLRHAPTTNQILALSVVTVLLPPISNDYTLIHLYAPWFLLTLYAIRNPNNKHLWAIFGCFLLLFVPENYLIVWMPSLGQGLRVAGQFKAIVLVVLLVLALRHPLPDQNEDAGQELCSV